MDVSPAFSVPLDTLKPVAAAPTAGAGRTPEQIKSVASKFEASFLSVMLGQMSEGVSTSAPFGGGQGEAAFKSFLNEEMAKGLAKRGGIGLSTAVQAQMLRMQGAH